MENMKTSGIVKVVIGLALILSVVGLFTPMMSIEKLPDVDQGDVAGATGNLLAEDYIPYVLYNAGFKSAKDFAVSGTSAFTGAVDLTSTFSVGSAGDDFTEMNAGVCYIRPYATTIAASTTATVDCQATALWNASAPSVSALNGISLNDNIVGTLSTTTAGTVSNGLVLAGISASSTSGFIVLRITNLTGGVFTWPSTAGLASGTAYYVSTVK